MAAQLVGAIGLTCTAPAAYYIGTGRLSERPSFCGRRTGSSQATRFISFSCESILPERSLSLRNLRSGKLFLLAQPVFFASLVVASFWRVLPALVIFAFVPALVRGTLWFFRKPEPLDVRSLGWSEMKQGVHLEFCSRLLSFIPRRSLNTRHIGRDKGLLVRGRAVINKRPIYNCASKSGVNYQILFRIR